MDTQNIITVANVDSTNDYALSLRSQELFRDGLVIITDYQTKGKGQRGNNWESKKGENLIISFVFELNIAIKEKFDISKVASLSVIDFLSDFNIKANIKWPNDILVGNKKISGILIHNIICDNIISHSIIGIGINVNQISFNEYKPKATSILLETNRRFNIKKIQKSIIFKVQNRFEDYRNGRNIDYEYIDILFKKDKVAVFESNSDKFNAIIRGVSDSGKLMIEKENIIQSFNIKELKMLF